MSQNSNPVWLFLQEVPLDCGSHGKRFRDPELKSLGGVIPSGTGTPASFSPKRLRGWDPKITFQESTSWVRPSLDLKLTPHEGVRLLWTLVDLSYDNVPEHPPSNSLFEPFFKGNS